MVLFFGPTGSGKSMQGQLIAARYGWRWISAGQLLRDVSDPEINSFLKEGKFVPDDYVNKLMFRQIDKALKDDGLDNIILDGYPRRIYQARELMKHNKKMTAIIVFKIGTDEIFNRLRLRGRMEDNIETIKQRIEQYNAETEPVINFFKENDVLVEEIDGEGTVGEVHDRIDDLLTKIKMEQKNNATTKN